jgi:hypothetical protein
MPIPVESKATDKPADEIYASWFIEEIKQLLNETKRSCVSANSSCPSIAPGAMPAHNALTLR